MVILARDLHHEVIDAAWPHFKAGFGKRALSWHDRTEACVGVASSRRVSFDFSTAEASSCEGLHVARVGNDAARVVMEAYPVERRMHKLFVARFETHLLVRRLSNERLRITAVHSRFEKEHVVHRVIPRSRGAIGFRIGRRIRWAHPVSAPHSGL